MTPPPILDRIRRVLSPAGAFPPGDPDLAPSAVLVPLAPDRTGGLTVLLVRRSRELSRHAGEISFPGGRVEPGDSSLVDTALRETSEELGISPSRVQILGSLAPTRTASSRYWIAPTVGLLLDPTPALTRSSEIEEVLSFPLDSLLFRTRRRYETFEMGDLDGVRFRVPFYDAADGVVIWGATGRILEDLRERLTTPDPAPPRTSGTGSNS